MWPCLNDGISVVQVLRQHVCVSTMLCQNWVGILYWDRKGMLCWDWVGILH